MQSPQRSHRVYFYPRPPRGGRLTFIGLYCFTVLFLSTPSARRATNLCKLHFPRVFQFLSTPSARRATVWLAAADRHCAISIHALREEGDPHLEKPGVKGVISIHALREEGDVVASPTTHNPPTISIHALREEGDWAIPALKTCIWEFLSTPSARRATRCSLPRSAGGCDFYPRPPRGGRPNLLQIRDDLENISIHALREEGDPCSMHA